MKGNKRLLGVLMILGALIIMQLPVKEADASTSASPFKMEGTKLVKYRGTEKTVSIPATVEVIGKSAFEDKDTVEVVVIPASVKRVEAYAFWGCDNLEKVIIGTGLTEIGDYVFSNCVGLTDITIPTNIRRIGIQAFSDCVNLKEITIPFQVTDIHETAFDGCTRLVIDCERGTYADEYAQLFYERQKEMAEYEDVPEYSGEITVPQVTATPEPQYTPDPELEKNLLGSTYIVDNQAVVFLDNQEPIVYGTEATKEPTQEGEDNQENNSDIEVTPETVKLKKYTVVDGLIIADQAYYKNKKIKDMVLPAGITEIGEFSFARSSLESIKIPDTLETIHYGAFYYCDKLTKVELPSGIKNVEPNAFEHTAWVEQFMSGMNEGDNDFLISNGVLVAYRGNKSKVVVPEGVRVIAAEVFKDHSEIVSLELPKSLEVIGEAAFEDCNQLEKLSIGKNVAKIKDRAFANCNISKFRIPKSVTELGIKAFDDTAKISYEGSIPERTYEATAQRLSNETFRTLGKLTGEPGVTVQGINRAYAVLAGAKRGYTLNVNATEDRKVFEQAFRRNLNAVLPADAQLYSLELTDGSEVPLTKLGKQLLTVTLPIQDAFKGQELTVYVLDRNGQPELLNSKEVQIDGTDSVLFEMDYVSDIAICATGFATEEVSIISMTGQAQSEQEVLATVQNPLKWLKWLFVAGVLILGVGFILKKSK
ncbi:MAG: leucine-rich repeat domain-containing protein [Lachnospiraceae bacterium]|nr:leucine-rich repeat domain-containing protein [Lachnospiraceae bacterium]